MENNVHQNFLIGALMGGLAGAAAVLLMTPTSGEALRAKLMSRFMHKVRHRRSKGHSPLRTRAHAKPRRRVVKKKARTA